MIISHKALYAILLVAPVMLANYPCIIKLGTTYTFARQDKLVGYMTVKDIRFRLECLDERPDRRDLIEYTRKHQDRYICFVGMTGGGLLVQAQALSSQDLCNKPVTNIWVVPNNLLVVLSSDTFAIHDDGK